MTTFGYWLRRRRKALDLTQDALAQRVSCSGFTIRKIEADERRPSRHLADRLAVSLAVPADERRAFLEAARAVRAADRMPLDAVPVDAATRAATPGCAVDSPTDPPADAAAQTPRDSTPFVGRGIEHGLLIGLVARLTAGTGHAVLIEGEPGIGKSRLMREVACYAQAQGLPTLATNCYQIERAIPYQPVIDLVTRVLDHAPAAALRHLAPVSLAELAALVPAVAERFPGLPRLSDDFPQARQARLFRALDQLLEAARQGRPLILTVDDVQWADDASAQVLHYLARHAAERPVLMIFAYRDEELCDHEPLARWVASVLREAHARRVPLARLAPADCASLVATLGGVNLGVPGLAERLHRETEGNPFFLMSMLHSLREGELHLGEPATEGPWMLPDALRAAVRARLAYVPQEARATLEAAAVFGRRFDFDMLLAATHEPEERLLDALETLVKRRLLREEGEGGVYDFSHDKLREVVYGDIGGARRRQLHRSVALALESRGESDAHERDARLAEHYERGHDWPRALLHLVAAGEDSLTLFAMRDALHWFDRAVALSQAHVQALDAPARLALYARRGAARAQAGQTDGAVADFRRVIDAARASGEREKARDALIQLGMAYRRADAYDDATACLTEALAESRAMNDQRHAADTLYHLGTVAWSTGRNVQAIAYHQEAVDICERGALTDLVAVQAYHGRGEAHFANAEPAAAIRCYSRSLELARGIGDKSYESENLMMIGYACTGSKGLGDYARARVNFEAALEIASAADLQWHMGPTLLGLDHVRACTGHYGEAWSGMQKTLLWLQGVKHVRYQLIAYDFLGHLLLDLGLHEQAVQTMQHGLALGVEAGIMFWRQSIDANLAIARARLGQRGLAPALEAARERSLRSADRYMTLRCLEALAEVAFTEGDAPRCRGCGDELLALAEANGLREIEGIARRWRGEALFAENAIAAAHAELSRAAALAQDVGRSRLMWDIESTLARVCAAQGESGAARHHETKAGGIAQAIKASVGASGLEVRLRAVGSA